MALFPPFLGQDSSTPTTPSSSSHSNNPFKAIPSDPLTEDPDKILADVLNGRERIVSNPRRRGQYEQEAMSPSTAGLAALNCAQNIFRLKEFEDDLNYASDGYEKIRAVIVSPEATKDIFSLCSSWPSEHMEVEDILKVPLFDNSFELVKVKHDRCNYGGLLAVMKDLLSVDKTKHGSVAAAVITRSPETLVCLKLPIMSRNVFMILDFHPRPAHPLGPGFILNSSVEETALYLDGVLSTEILSPELLGQPKPLRQISSHVIVPKFLFPRPVEDVIKAVLVDTSATILQLKAALAKCQRRESDLLEENQDIQSKVTRPEQLQRSTDVQGKEKDATILQLKTSVTKCQRQELHLLEENQNLQSKVTRLEQLRQHIDIRGREKDTIILQLKASLAECQRQESHLLEEKQRLLEENQDLQSKVTHLKQLPQLPPTFDCGICFETLPLDDIAEFKGCKHSFCRICLGSQITSKLNERRYPIFCPTCVADNADEPSSVDDEMFESLGPTSSGAAIFRELQLAAHSVKLYCRKCRETMFVDREDYALSDIIECPVPGCSHIWCKNCQQTVKRRGPRHSCDGSSELEHLMKESGWRRCPGCQAPIQKDSGCNHMTCSAPACNTHFCYLCGEMIIQSVAQREISTAMSTHYENCRMFGDA